MVEKDFQRSSVGILSLIVCSGLLLRWAVSLYPYSGENKPPMYGDYEAQRHWMEITVALPINTWYHNTSDNDLMYWGLDYPPLTAYHSYVNGLVGSWLNAEFVALFDSRGYESYDHKFFMRATAIIADALIYFPSFILYFYCLYKVGDNIQWTKTGVKTVDAGKEIIRSSALIQILLAFCYPGLILIDHGHFQYNSVALGFTVLAVAVLMHDKYILSSFLFCLALNYKQMSLYHALPFFVYLLRRCLPHPDQTVLQGIKKLGMISLTVVCTFIFLWSPFLTSYESFAQVVFRLFPLSRGIFEDKVSNFWCIFSVVYNLRSIPHQRMAQICLASTLIAVIPSLLHLFRFPHFRNFLLSLIITSLSFFLFSFQVHEKSILLVSVVVILYTPFDPFPVFWFLLISTFSMLPLLVKDGQVIPFVALSIIYYILFSLSFEFQSTPTKSKSVTKEHNINISLLVRVIFFLSVCGCIVLFLGSLVVEPPSRYPFLWPLLVSAYSAGHFLCFLVYFYVVQFSIKT